MAVPSTSATVTGSELDEFQTRRLILNRPAKANAVDLDLAHDLLRWVELSGRDGCRALVLEGAGRNFCAGFDFSDLEASSAGDIIDRFVAIERTLQAIRRAPFVSFALVHGAAFGAGADLAIACTYRIGGPRARFRFPGFQFGAALGTRHLAQLAGYQRARDVLLRNRVVDADEALAMGLLTHLGDEAGLRGIADQLAADTRTLSRDAVAQIHALTACPEEDRDLANLVRSLSEPGLHERIAAYRARQS